MDISRIKCHPTAGYIPDIDKGAKPGKLDNHEEMLLRTLAKEVAEIAKDPCQTVKRDRWYRHNRLEKGRPMMLIFPEDGWYEIISEQSLKLKDMYWRQWEWYFKHLIYRYKNIKDDFVIEPEIFVDCVATSRGFGFPINFIKNDSGGSYVWEPPIKEPRDIKKIHSDDIYIDDFATSRRYDEVCEVFSDILPVHKHVGRLLDVNLISTATFLRGTEQLLIDFYDRPEWVHELMNFLAESQLKNLKYLETGGYLSLNNRNHYTDSGGIGYTDELPASGFDADNVRLCDLWGFGLAQEFTSVSAAHHEEFLLDYQLRLLELFGLVAYGCCEPYTKKFDMLEKIPRLRRVSISPWSDVETASKRLSDKCILSWKPHPAMVAGSFEPGKIKEYMGTNIHFASDCILEIILKDLYTINNEPERIKIWNDITREEIEKIWGC